MWKGYVEALTSQDLRRIFWISHKTIFKLFVFEILVQKVMFIIIKEKDCLRETVI